MKKLQDGCRGIGHCDTGSAVITPGFVLTARYIIHAVDPRWKDGSMASQKLLYGAYRRSMELAVAHGCRSIGFPLISAGIFGYPILETWPKAFDACNDFLDRHTGSPLEIVFAVLDDKILETGKEILETHDAPGHKEAEQEERRKPDTLTVSGREYDAVFFHLPEEPNGYLSSWYASPFVLDGIRFSSAEQYIMYRKCMLFGDETSARAVLATDDTASQQVIGRKAGGYIERVWDGARHMVLLRGLLAKFSQNADLKEKLLSTGDAILVECARTDKVWACGIRLSDDKRHDASAWTGSNRLGFTLMEVRSMLRES